MRLDADRVRRTWATRWGLAAPLASPDEAARRLLALHGTDPATLVLSVAARTGGTVKAAVAALNRSLEQDKTLVRAMAMRRTVHVVPVDDYPWMLSIYADKVGSTRRKDAEGYLVAAGLASADEAPARYRALEASILDALRGRELTVTELSASIPELAARFDPVPGKSYSTAMAIGGRFVDAVGATGPIVRAKARGSWKVSTCSWARLDDWLPDLPPPPAIRDARATLVRRYLDAFGPATVDDVAWWAGLPKGTIKAALADVDVVDVDVPGWAPRVDLRGRSYDAGPTGAVLLPALDPSIMGWADRTPILDDAWRPTLFDRSGNPAPTIWFDGRVVGAWAQPKTGEIRFHLYASAPEDEVRAAVARMEATLGGERVAPRFPTPIVKELAG